jgi:hypothetical protein
MEPIENLKGTFWEQSKIRKKKSSPPSSPPQPKLKRKNKIKALWGHAESSYWLHENFYFQNCLSPFLAWANDPIINWGYLFIYLISKWQPKWVWHVGALRNHAYNGVHFQLEINRLPLSFLLPTWWKWSHAFVIKCSFFHKTSY